MTSNPYWLTCESKCRTVHVQCLDLPEFSFRGKELADHSWLSNSTRFDVHKPYKWCLTIWSSMQRASIPKRIRGARIDFMTGTILSSVATAVWWSLLTHLLSFSPSLLRSSNRREAANDPFEFTRVSEPSTLRKSSQITNCIRRPWLLESIVVLKLMLVSWKHPLRPQSTVTNIVWYSLRI